jgi:hypothetical protein
MSDPRVGFLHEASAPILFVAWMALASEWYTATTDTKYTKVTGYSTHDVVYAERVGCAYGSKACDILFWYLATLYCTSLCFFAELMYIIWVQHREQWKSFFVNQFDRVCSRLGFRRNTASTTTASTIDPSPNAEESYDLESYSYPSISSSGSAAVDRQPSNQLDILSFPNPPLHPPPPVFPHNVSQTNGLVSLPSHTPGNDFVLGQDDDKDVAASAGVTPAALQCHQAPRRCRNQAAITDEIEVLEYLPTTVTSRHHCQQPVDEIEVLEYLPTIDASHPLHKEPEGSVVLSIPTRIDTPRPIKKNFADVAQMLGLNMPASGSGSRANTAHPHHPQYVASEPSITRVLVLNTIEYDQDPRPIIEAAFQRVAQSKAQSSSLQSESALPVMQDAVKAFAENVVQSASSTLLEFASSSKSQIPSAVVEIALEDVVDAAAVSELSISSPLQSPDASVDVAAEECDSQSPICFQSQATTDDETIVDDETELSTNGRIYGYDLDDYRRRQQKRRWEVYRASVRSQMLDLAKYANYPLPERRQP